MPKINKRFATLIDAVQQNSSSNVRNIDSISEQLSSLKDLLIEDRRLNARLRKQRSAENKNGKIFSDDLDEIRSKRNKIDSEIQSLLNEEKSLQKADKKKQDEESTFYSRTGDSELRSGNLVSGLLFSFLGRNEKKQEEIEKENNQADSDERKKRLEYLENEKTENKKERKARRDELTTPKKPTASPSEPVITPTSAIDPSIQDEKYAQKDKEIASPTPIVIQNIIDPVTVEISKISKESLDDLKKLLESVEFKSSGGGISSLSSLFSTLPALFNPVTLSIAAAAAAIGVSALATKGLLDKIGEADKASKEQQAKDLQELKNKLAKGVTPTKEEENKIIQKAGESTKATSDAVANLANSAGQSNLLINAKNAEENKKQAEENTKIEILKAKLNVTDTLGAPTKLIEQWISDQQKILDTDKMGYDAKQDLKKQLDYNKSVLSGRTDRTGGAPLAPTQSPIPARTSPTPTIPAIPAATGTSPTPTIPVIPTIPAIPAATGTSPTPTIPVIPTIPAIPAATGTSPTSVAAAAARIAGAETGGNPDLAYGDMFDKKQGKIDNKLKTKLQTAEEYSGGKKLSEMTIQEVQDFQKYREKSQKATGAVGKYQFIPSTLTGLVKATNMDPKTTLFNEETQNKLNVNFQEQNLKILRKKSENLGLGREISGGMQYMGHYIGAGGASAVMAAAQKSPDQTVEQALLAAGLKSPVIPDKNGNLINAELRTTLVKDFENILQARIDKITPTQESNRTGESGSKLYTAAAVNRDLNNQPNSGTNIVNAPQTTVVNNQTASNKQVREAPKDTSNIFQSIFNRLSYGAP